MSTTSRRHQEIVKKLLDAKAVDFAAIGRVLAEVGPSLSLSDEFEGDGFCGTIRRFIRVFWVDDPLGPLESLGELKRVDGGSPRVVE